MIAGSPLRLGILGIPFVASVLFFGPGGQSRPYLVVSGGVGPALLYWLAINIDLLTLVPIDIGLRYLLMPIMSTAIGHVAARR